MKIKDLADSKVPTIDPSLTIGQALRELHQRGRSFAFVISNCRPVGVFFCKSIRGVHSLPGANELKVAEVMGPVHWFYGDWAVEEVGVAMVEQGLDTAIVRDRNGFVLGFVDLSSLPRRSAALVSRVPRLKRTSLAYRIAEAW